MADIFPAQGEAKYTVEVWFCGVWIALPLKFFSAQEAEAAIAEHRIDHPVEADGMRLGVRKS